MVYAANVADEELAVGNEYTERVKKFASEEGSGAVIVSAQVGRNY